MSVFGTARAERARDALSAFARRARAKAGLIFGLLVFGLALVALHHLLAEFQYREVVEHLRSLSWAAVAGAVALSAISYLTLAGYDLSALHYVGARLPFRTVFYASFTGYAISNNLGFTMLSGGSVRYRVYSAAGLPMPDVARVIVFCSVTFTVGICAVGSAGFFLQPDLVARLLRLPVLVVQGIAGLLIAILFGTLIVSMVLRRGIRIGRWTIDVPSPGLVLVQVLISSADILLTAAALYVLMPPTDLGYGAFLGIYCAALLAGLISHVPGGIGVFESIVLIGLAGRAPAAGVLGALLAYRAIYYLLPLVLATMLLAGGELAEHRTRAAKVFRLMGPLADRLGPTAIATLVFASGVVLLISSATPGDYNRLLGLGELLPLPVLEIAHLLAGLSGLALLLLARGLFRRMDAAWAPSILMLGIAIVLSLVKELGYEEAVLLGFTLAALAACRDLFTRPARLTALRFSRGWLMAAVGAVAGATWLALFSYKEIGYTGELWFRYDLAADAPRSLRAIAAVFLVLGVVSLLQLSRPAAPKPRRPRPDELDRVQRILAREDRIDGNLALLGDKALLFGDSDDGFLMYGVRGMNWIALSDPIGDRAHQAELIWRFRELCDRNGARPAFYGVRASTLPLYLDVGLIPVKLGDQACVKLSGFTLAGAKRKDLRDAERRGREDGFDFQVVPAASTASLMDELARVSDQWLEAGGATEKGYSTGRFDPAYLARFDIAVVRREDRIVAFANIWRGAPGTAVGVDLVRHADPAPDYLTDFLFARLLLWARDRGYAEFALGMVPLAEPENRALLPVWRRFGATLFHLGGPAGRPQELWDLERKFAPVWEPRYLVCSEGLAPAQVLAGVAALIGGDADSERRPSTGPG
ncbi:MAG TPA: bifunctional lysylphosphatidylglycerol flippase/synthetase MprF [Alphaproteobacteria bacterium]|nr:bifunctional lysylphosphatidylglycerol flippase/synthetase MprF [Alphaproteobacteria bacterium]